MFSHRLILENNDNIIKIYIIVGELELKKHDTPMLDELETGPWPSFISGIKRLRDTHPESRINEMTNDLLGQLEHSYETRKGYWKGGTVSVYGYGGGIIPRFSEVGDAFPQSKEFHTLRAVSYTHLTLPTKA